MHVKSINTFLILLPHQQTSQKHRHILQSGGIQEIVFIFISFICRTVFFGRTFLYDKTR